MSRKKDENYFYEEEDTEENVKCPPQQVPLSNLKEECASHKPSTSHNHKQHYHHNKHGHHKYDEHHKHEHHKQSSMESSKCVTPVVATNRDVELGDEVVAQVAPGSEHQKAVVAESALEFVPTVVLKRDRTIAKRVNVSISNNLDNATGHSRLTAWWGQCIFSAIAVGAHLTAINEYFHLKTSTKAVKWTASVMIVSMSLAFLALLAYHICADQFAGKLSEGGFILIVLALWSAGMPAIMDPENLQAVDWWGAIVNINLYFSTWACLFIAVWTFGSYVTQVHFKEDFFAVDASTPLGKWYMLTAVSVVAMSSSSRLVQFVCDFYGDPDRCKRVKFAISTGAVGTTFALVACLLGSRGLLKTYLEFGLSFIVFCMYTCAIAFVTFGGEKAPAYFMGNLYFSTWIGFSLAAFLVSKSFQKVNMLRKGDADEAESNMSISNNLDTATGHSRLTAWWAQCIFSAIAVGAHLTAIDGDLKTSTKEVKWTASVMIVSMCLAFLALLAYHIRADHFAGKLSEGGFVLIVLALWSAGMPAIMDPENLQAVDMNRNANLYFSSWACLFIAVWTFGSYVTQVHFNEDFFAVDASTPLGKWYMLTAASVIAMTSSSRLFQVVCDDDFYLDPDQCKRVKFAISTGAVGSILALVACLLGSRGLLKPYLEFGLAFIIFCMYTCAIVYVTFDVPEGPVKDMGNLYFSTWVGFALAAFLVSKSFQKVTMIRKGNAAGDAEAEASDKQEEKQEEKVDKKAEDSQESPPGAPLKVLDEEQEA